MARRTRPNGRDVWLDDYSYPIKGVVIAWLDPVALDETAQ